MSKLSKFLSVLFALTGSYEFAASTADKKGSDDYNKVVMQRGQIADGPKWICYSSDSLYVTKYLLEPCARFGAMESKSGELNWLDEIESQRLFAKLELEYTKNNEIERRD